MTSRPETPPDIGAADWREGVTRWARELRAVDVRHPWILQIAISGPPREPGQLAWLECGLRALERTNLDPHDTMAVIMLVLHYVRGEAQLYNDPAEGTQTFEESGPRPVGSTTLARARR